MRICPLSQETTGSMYPEPLCERANKVSSVENPVQEPCNSATAKWTTIADSSNNFNG